MKRIYSTRCSILHAAAAGIRRISPVLLGVAILIISLVNPVWAADKGLEIGLTGAWLELDASANGEWRLAQSLQNWSSVEDGRSPGFQLSGISARFSTDRFAVVAMWEGSGPFELRAQHSTGLSNNNDDAVSLSVEMQTFDVRIERPWQFGQRFKLLGRVGVTRLEVDQESWNAYFWGGLSVLETRLETSFVGWGPVVGGTMIVNMSESLTVFADLNLRWARGTANLRVTERSGPFDPDSWLPLEGEEPRVTRFHGESDRTFECFAANLGLRWRALPYLAVEAGWQLRDWSNYTAKAVSGPFVRLLVNF